MTDMATIQRQIAQIQSDTAAQSTVVASAITLINGLSGQLRDVKAQLASQGGVDTSALDAVITQLENNNTTLSTAVAANTAAAGEQPAPAAPPATPPAGGDVSQATDPQQSA